ncbi:MAG: hypothetical protein OXF20_12730 [Gammaproteobacteria bacterium]|nr:hypothetical protein [Gammaproteobacteria bacterium]
MPDIDFGALSDMGETGYRDEIERHLFDLAMSLFSITPTVAFYDLTSTCFEGRADGNALARHGRSKEKRSDCPLMTLAVVIGASGFVVKSRVFAGNVAERTTLEEMLSQLGFGRDAVAGCFWPNGEFQARESAAVSGRSRMGPEAKGSQGSRQVSIRQGTSLIRTRLAGLTSRTHCRAGALRRSRCYRLIDASVVQGTLFVDRVQV